MKLEAAPGSISQVREVAHKFLLLAKNRGVPVFLIGHINKEGSIAGPKALEHIVDTVLYFEGERHHNHRIVRAAKKMPRGVPGPPLELPTCCPGTRDRAAAP